MEAIINHGELPFKVDLRCPRCYRGNMKRHDGGFTPHKRLSVKNMKVGAGAKWVQCVGYERANATKNPERSIA